jgi:hypothetical protein
MPYKLSSATIANATIVTTAETTVCSVGPYTYDLPVTGAQSNPGQGVTISASVNITASAAATTATLRVRQGSITGPIVGVGEVTPATASVAQDFSIEVLDVSRVPAQSGGVTYFVTVQFAGSSGNSTVNAVEVDVDGN